MQNCNCNILCGRLRKVMNESIDPRKCPICGEVNSCEILEGTDTCWCFNYTFPDKLKESVPQKLQGKSCICKKCAEKEK